MLKSWVLAGAVLVMSGCEYLAPVPRAGEVAADMNRVQVLTILGAPTAKHRSGDREAWEYCMNGWVVDDYVVVWLEHGKVVRTDVMNDVELAHCTAPQSAFSWDNAPST